MTIACLRAKRTEGNSNSEFRVHLRSINVWIILHLLRGATCKLPPPIFDISIHDSFPNLLLSVSWYPWRPREELGAALSGILCPVSHQWCANITYMCGLIVDVG